jgi:hypothetical protein
MTETAAPAPVPPDRPTPVLPAKAIKPGWQTTEFYLSLVTAILPWLSSHIPPQWQAGLSVVSGIFYAISRGLAKLNP